MSTATISQAAASPLRPIVPADDSISLGYDFDSAAWDESHMGTPLDLTGYTPTFTEDFLDLSGLTDSVSGAGHLYAPGIPDTSSAKFRSPLDTTPTDTYTISSPSVLQIKMQKIGVQWYSGHLQSVNTQGHGFAQQYGYFEAKCAFNKAIGWPSFWLYSQQRFKDTASSKCEIDVFEVYGDNDYGGLHVTCHRHAPYRPQPRHAQVDAHHSDYINMATGTPLATWNTPDLFTGTTTSGFHRYGVKIDQNLIIKYFDGLELARFPTYPEAKQPLVMFLSLQMQDAFAASAVTTYLWCDWIKAWAAP